MSHQSDTDDEPIDGSTRRSVLKSAAAGTGLVLFGSTAGAASAQSSGLRIDGPSEIVYGHYNVFVARGGDGGPYIWNHDKYSDDLYESKDGAKYELKPVDRDLIGGTVEIFLTVDGETVTKEVDVVEGSISIPGPTKLDTDQKERFTTDTADAVDPVWEAEYLKGSGNVDLERRVGSPYDPNVVEMSADSPGVVKLRCYCVDGHVEDEIDVVIEGSNSGGPIPIGNNPPRDPDGDGLYEDVDGDGDLSIADVSLLFDNRNSEAVQEYSEFYNFSGGDPSEVTIGDVRALYNQVS